MSKKLVKLSAARIKKIVEAADRHDDALVDFFAELYTPAEWRLCKYIDGYAYASKTTVDKILEMLFIKFPDKQQTINLMWLNMGYSVNNNIPDWKVEPAKLVF